MKQKNPDPYDFYGLTYSLRYFSKEIPKDKISSESLPAKAVYQMIHDELNMDANPALNLASFVTTWMEPEAIRLITENIHKNFIDHDEYPQSEVIHQRCLQMLADLFHAPNPKLPTGTATVGSSEAIMLALLGHKWRWKKRREKARKNTDKPNIVFGSEVHVCWEKFAKYFDVEMRMIPIEENQCILNAKNLPKYLDENTICIGAILGTTYTGQLDPIEKINDVLLRVKKEKGWDIPIHVDAASGGFVIPFTQPDFAWDFRLEQVRSINVSGHKYGLVYPGIGWAIWKEKKDFPEELIFKVNYLGGWMPTYTLNFSRSCIGVIGQYYNFLRLGKKGYQKVMKNALSNAKHLAKLLKKSGKFILINEGGALPIVAMRLKKEKGPFTVFDLSHKLRERGWVVSAYTLPPNAQKIAIMRVVVREHFSLDMAQILYQDIVNALKALEKTKREKKIPVPKEKTHHPC